MHFTDSDPNAPRTITAAEQAELDALTAEHGRRAALTRLTDDPRSPELVRLVPRWYSHRGRPCGEPAASDVWEVVEIDAACEPALVARAVRVAAEDNATIDAENAEEMRERLAAQEAVL